MQQVVLILIWAKFLDETFIFHIIKNGNFHGEVAVFAFYTEAKTLI
jgi:hypothetical protein